MEQILSPLDVESMIGRRCDPQGFISERRLPHIDCQGCDLREIMLTTDHELITSKRITSMIALPIKHTSDHYNVLSVGRVELIELFEYRDTCSFRIGCYHAHDERVNLGL